MTPHFHSSLRERPASGERKVEMERAFDFPRAGKVASVFQMMFVHVVAGGYRHNNNKQNCRTGNHGDQIPGL